MAMDAEIRRVLVRGDVRDADLLARLLPRGRRGVPPGRDGRARRRPRRRARLRRAQRPRHRRPARRDARRRASAGWCWPGRWWSTARAATTARSTAPSGRARGRAPTSTPDGSSRAARAAAGTWSPALVAEDAPFDPRSTYAATQGRARSTWSAAWARQTGGAAWSLRYHNVYGPRMPRDTPYAGVASIFRSALERGEAPRVLEDGCQRRDFVHVTDVAAANVLALTTRSARGRPHRGQRLLRRAAHDRRRSPARSPRRPVVPSPWSSAAPGRGTCAMSSPTRRGPGRCWASGRRWASQPACGPSPPTRCALRPGRSTSPNGKRPRPAHGAVAARRSWRER